MVLLGLMEGLDGEISIGIRFAETLKGQGYLRLETIQHRAALNL